MALKKVKVLVDNSKKKLYDRLYEFVTGMGYVSWLWE